MMNLYDIAYGVGVLVASPYWLLKPSARRKVLGALRERMGNVPARTDASAAVMIHAVSLGEINATPALVDRLRAARPALFIIVSTTTTTGFTRATQLYGGQAGMTVIRYPLDFTLAVVRVLDRLRPGAVVLMELEVWPNFVRQCVARDIPVLVANGRLTTKSHRRYKLVRPLVSSMFRRLARVLVQDETYAARFIDVGVRPEALHVVGTMKFDNATVADRVDGDAALADAVGLPARSSEAPPVWVCGSTGPGEEAIVLDVYRVLCERFDELRLVIVPRKPERFDEVAELIGRNGFALVRRSHLNHPPAVSSNGSPIILGDTIGELRTFYSLADVVFVGRTLVDLGASQHGSDMIEPAALAKPVIVGPFVTNFASAMRQFRTARAVIDVGNADELRDAVVSLLADRANAQAMAGRARETVLDQQGATDRHVTEILRMLPDHQKYQSPV